MWRWMLAPGRRSSLRGLGLGKCRLGSGPKLPRLGVAMWRFSEFWLLDCFSLRLLELMTIHYWVFFYYYCCWFFWGLNWFLVVFGWMCSLFCSVFVEFPSRRCITRVTDQFSIDQWDDENFSLCCFEEKFYFFTRVKKIKKSLIINLSIDKKSNSA